MIKKRFSSHSIAKLIMFISVFAVASCRPQNVSPTLLTAQSPTSSQANTPTASGTPTEVIESISCLPQAVSDIALPVGSHVGLQTPPELKGIESLDSLLIQSGDEHSMGLSLMLEGPNQYLFWLEKFCINKNGQRFTEVADEVILPPLKEDEFAITTCQLVNDTNSHVVAIGYSHEEIISGKTCWKVLATQAWLIDTKEWTFVEIPAEQLANVSCIKDY